MKDEGRQPAAGLSVVFVIARYPPALGGTEKQAENLAARLEEEGDRVTVLTQKLPGFRVKDPPGVLRLSPTGSGFVPSACFGVNLAVRLLRRRPDLVQAFLLSSPALFSALAGRVAGFPVVAKLGASGPHGDAATSRKGFWSRVRLSLVLRLADHFVVPSADVAVDLCSLGIIKKRYSLIPNGVDRNLFSPSAEPAGPSTASTVIFAGRLESQKDPETLIRAWASVSGDNPGARLIIIGEGKLRSGLEEMVRNLNLAGSVSFRGRADHGTMAGLYRLGGIFVLPSRSEGLSNALLEAMASGLAPVVSSIPANMTVVGDDGALFFTPGDHAGLADGLRRLLNEDPLREDLAKRARERSGRYSLEAAGRSYGHLYRRLLRDRGERE